MTGVLRGGRGGQSIDVRRFTAEAALNLVPDPAAPFLIRIAALQDELDDARGATLALEAATAAREAAAHEAGRRAVKVDDAARVEAVAAAADIAVKALERRIEDLERLAGALAEIGLEKLFGETADRAGLVAASIGAATRRLRAGAAVRVVVSRVDFDEAARSSLQRAVAPLPVVVEETLLGGDARLDLELGVLDLALERQWERLRDALRALPEADGR